MKKILRLAGRALLCLVPTTTPITGPYMFQMLGILVAGYTGILIGWSFDRHNPWPEVGWFLIGWGTYMLAKVARVTLLRDNAWLDKHQRETLPSRR
jgi:hypothetical protein